MALKIPTLISKEWIAANCRCKRIEDRLLCQESCPVHNTYDEVTEVQRRAITTMTHSMGLRLDWWLEDADKR